MSGSRSVFILLFVFVFTLSVNAQISEKVAVVLGGAASIPAGSFGNDQFGEGKTGYSLFAETYLKASSTLRVNVTFMYGLNPLSETNVKVGDFAMNRKRNDIELKWFMAGVGTEFKTDNNTSYFVVPQIGILFSTYPEIYYSFYSRENRLPDIEQSSFAYGVNAGVMIKPFVLGIKYYLSHPVYETWVKYDSIEGYERGDFRFNISTLNLYIGFAF